MRKRRLGFTDKQLKQIRLIVGKNLAAARRNAGMNQAEVMSKVWGVENTRNRISEIENGNKDLTLVEHIKAISKNDHEALLEESKALCGAIIDSKYNNPIVTERLANLMRTVRRIESKQARQAMAVEAHMMQVKQRLDKDDNHMMLSDLDLDYQYSLPLPEPDYSIAPYDCKDS